MRHALFFAVAIALVSTSSALSVFCEACYEQPTPSNSNIESLKKLERFSQSLARYQKLRRDVNQLKNASAIKLEEHGQYLREMRAHSVSVNTRNFIESAGSDLQALSQALVSIESFNQSLPKLGPGQRVETEEKIRALQKLKIGILLKQPLLAHPKIKNFLVEKARRQDFTQLADENVQNLLKEALETSALGLLKEKDEYEDFLEDGRAPLLNGSRPPDPENVNSYLKTIAKRFPTVMNRLVQIKHHNLALMPEDERNDYCEYENELTAVKNRENLIKISGDVGAVALSFAGGIIGRGAVLATAAGRARLIEWGVVGSSEAYLAMSALSDYQQLISTCDRQFSDFTNTPNSQKLNSIETCYQNLSQQMLQASLSVVAGSVPIAAGLYKVTSAALAKTIPIVRKESVFTEKVFYKSGAAQYANETGSYTIFDLSRRDLVEREKLEALSEKYLNFVSDEYKKRLNLGKGEVDSFMETSKAYKHRTTYVISTKPGVMKSSGANAATDEIQGGVGLVTSQKKSDLLPLEKATGVTLDRSEGGVAEIVRLTTAKDSPRTVPTELLDQVAQLILGNPSLQTIYIYTSTVHARLYKRYGIYIKEDRKFQGGRDVLLKIDVNELRMHAKLRSAG